MGEFDSIPFWVFVAMGLGAMALGIGIRKWLDYRKLREQERMKEHSKEVKKLMKRQRRLAKKGKGKKPGDAPGQTEA